MGLAANKVYQADCIEGLERIEPGSIDLAFAAPPFNIGYQYDVYHDQRAAEEYLDWTRKWMLGVRKALKSGGTFWLAIGDEYAAELKLIAQKELGFTCRSWVIWYYTFGVNCTRMFSRSHTHLLYFVNDPKSFTFNADDPAVRVPSARQLVYADGRANPKGRLPDNTWILRPQDAPDGFAPDQDTWYFARVAGTFKEREGFHGCQMPEQLLGRIIRCCSNPGEIVLDPFGGSGTTFTVAKKLGRRWIGFELSKDYAERIKARLHATRVGEPLDGPADPLTSAPPTLAPPKTRRRRLSASSAKGKTLFGE
jgi:DNA modification methylase